MTSDNTLKLNIKEIYNCPNCSNKYDSEKHEPKLMPVRYLNQIANLKNIEFINSTVFLNLNDSVAKPFVMIASRNRSNGNRTEALGTTATI